MKRILTMAIIGLLCFSMFSILAPRVKAETGSWTTKASLPHLQCLFGAAAVNGKIYAIGGQYQEQGQFVWLDTNYEYDPLNNNWVSRASMPTKRTTLTVVSANDKIYAIGGAASTSGGAYSTNEEYDPVSNSWTSKAPMQTPRNWISGTVVNGKVYVIGGSDNSGGIFSMNEVYDPLVDTWTTKTPDPQARLAYGIGVVNNKIYVIGGWVRPGPPPGEPTTLNEEYDPQTDTWTTRAPMPTARNGLAVAVVNNKIYAIGGATDFNPWTNNLNVVEEYDPATDTWRMVQPMPTSRSLLSAAAIGNKIYALGGWGSTGYLDTNEEFSLVRAPTKWAVVLGVNEYINPEDNGKEGPINSANDMYDLLVNKFSFPAANVHLKTDAIGNSADDIKKVNITNELNWLIERVLPGDTAVFYYAGHGDQISTGTEFLVPHDSNLINDTELAGYVNKIDTEKLLVILDMSYSGGFVTDGQTLRQGISGIVPSWTNLAEGTPNGRIVLTACAENVGPKLFGRNLRDAVEFPYRYFNTGTRYEMVFTHLLMMGFNGEGDSNRDGKVTVEEAFRFAQRRAMVVQTPLMYDGYPAYGSSGDLYLG